MRWRIALLTTLLLMLWTSAALHAQPTSPPAEPTATAAPAAGQPAPTAGEQPATPDEAGAEGEAGAEAGAEGEAGVEGEAAATGADGAPTRTQLFDLHRRIDELKEQIRRTHTILALLNAELFEDTSSGGHLTVKLHNRFGSYFKIRRALVVLDGAVQYRGASNTEKLSDRAIIPVFDGAIQPGDHTLQVVLHLQGNGYGIWSYFKGYRFELRSSHSFTVTPGKTTRIKIIGHDQGDVTTPFQERPAVKYSERISSGLKSQAGK